MRYSNEDLIKIKRLQNLYNTLPNLLWSGLSIVPIFIFCYNFIEQTLLYIFLVISALPIFLPNSFLNKIQLSSTTGIYKKLGVHNINKIAQNGEFINRRIKKQVPAFKAVYYNKVSAKKLLSQTYMYEKFHLILFIFFSLITIYAFTKNHTGWATIFLITNLFYNIYPNLLQQYIRIKLKLYIKRKM